MVKVFFITAITAVALGGASPRTSKKSFLISEEKVAEINAKATAWTVDFDFKRPH